MARSTVAVKLFNEESTKSVGITALTPVTISTANGAVIPKAFDNKLDSFDIIVTATTAGNVVLNAGEYCNACLGNLTIPCAVGTTVITVYDQARFENKDGSVNIDFATIAGTISAIAKHAGIKPLV